jgi:alpha-tubulin suppressor-like RCC1 family protein
MAATSTGSADPATKTVASGLSKAFTVVVSTPVVTPTTIHAAPAVAMSAQLSATLGTPPYRWSASGLPPGLILHSNGLVDGITGALGTSQVTVTVTDANDDTGTAIVPVVVAGPQVVGWGANGGQLGTGTWVGGELGPTPTLIPPSPHAIVGLTTGYTIAADGNVVEWSSPGGAPYEVRNAQVIAQAAGTSAHYVVRSDGTVWADGAGTDGQLGNGSTTDSYAAPVQVSGLTNAVAVAAGTNFALAMLADGTVWAWGAGAVGQLGNAVVPMQTTPGEVSFIGSSPATKAVSICAGTQNGYALLADGAVLSWGNNDGGELGNHDPGILFSSAPQTVVALSSVRQLACADAASFCLALKTDGTVVAWGNNDVGELGNGGTTSSSLPTTVPGLSGVVAIANGLKDGYALTGTGTVEAWGSNLLGELGAGTSTPGSLSPVLVPGVTGATALSATGNDAFATLPG